MEDSGEAPGAAFWNAALAFYARPGAQTALLDLQDRLGGDVMAILWSLAAARAGRAISEGDVALFKTSTEAARAEAMARRAERRAGKGGPEAQYADLKRAELAAERAIAAAAPPPASAGAHSRTSGVALARANLARMLAWTAPMATKAEAENLARIAFDA